jgi:hypothetical protein
MDDNDLMELASEFLNELSQLGHGAQCETDNYTNSAPCDCGLASIKIKASALIEGLNQLVTDLN